MSNKQNVKRDLISDILAVVGVLSFILGILLWNGIWIFLGIVAMIMAIFL